MDLCTRSWKYFLISPTRLNERDDNLTTKLYYKRQVENLQRNSYREQQLTFFSISLASTPLLPHVQFRLFSSTQYTELPSPPSHLRTRFAPYFKRHISKDHASSTGKMSMLAAGLPPLHHTAGLPLGVPGIVSPCQLATNYTLMRHRVIRRRCAEWKRQEIEEGRERERERDLQRRSPSYDLYQSINLLSPASERFDQGGKITQRFL